MTFEAHSTDYQTPAALRSLVLDGWRVLKVGPGLTFAMREALFGLAAIEPELVPATQRSELPAVVERQMLALPDHWERYYSGRDDPPWPGATATATGCGTTGRTAHRGGGGNACWKTLAVSGIPEPLLSAFLPDQYDRVRDGVARPGPEKRGARPDSGRAAGLPRRLSVAGAPGARHVLTTQSAG